MKASQLRDLTREFAGGKMDRQAYVAERTRLIDGIVSGEIPIRYRELEPAAASPARPISQRWLGLAAASLVGLLLVALVAHYVGSPAPDAAANQPASVPNQNPGVELLATFNGNDDWSEASLSAFEAEWNGLTAFQQENARRSADFRQLRHQTSQRIREQEALLAAGEMEALMKAVRLREFGERMGFTER